MSLVYCSVPMAFVGEDLVACRSSSEEEGWATNRYSFEGVEQGTAPYSFVGVRSESAERVFGKAVKGDLEFSILETDLPSALPFVAQVVLQADCRLNLSWLGHCSGVEGCSQTLVLHRGQVS